ncbi:MAG: molybdopterin-guanine dinucleotide biosynthesis protein B [Deltaproteobacteria bacterium]|nr:molybdopterin-guanine dinucleotide biosynthesis protein B [Deltaproteobacteria bacterium]
MTKSNKMPGAVSFIAKSGTGKTTLIVKIIKILSDRGYKVSSVKHTDHDFEADIPGKDSWRHKNAGAFSTMLISKDKTAFFSDVDSSFDAEIAAVISKYFNGSDIVIVEGFKDLKIKKIELLRKDIEGGLKPKFISDPNLILVCADEFIKDLETPQIDINDSEKIADFIEKHIINGRE